MLKIQFKDKHSDPIWVVERRYTIGSDSDNHLVIDDASVSPVHARLVTENNRLLLRDNNSLTGSYVNDQRVTEKQIFPGDTLRLGNIELDVLDPSSRSGSTTPNMEANTSAWSIVADSSWLAGQEYPINQPSVIVGRGNQCDIVIPGTHLSRQHARLTIEGKRVHVQDLSSANGTFINDQRVNEGFAVPGDRLRLDVYSFRLVGPQEDSAHTRVRQRPTPVADVTEPKPINTPPKRWITKPTSPGNRIEPTASDNTNIIWGLVSVLLVSLVALLWYIFV